MHQSSTAGVYGRGRCKCTRSHVSRLGPVGAFNCQSVIHPLSRSRPAAPRAGSPSGSAAPGLTQVPSTEAPGFNCPFGKTHGPPVPWRHAVEGAELLVFYGVPTERTPTRYPLAFYTIHRPTESLSQSLRYFTSRRRGERVTIHNPSGALTPSAACSAGALRRLRAAGASTWYLC